MCQRPHSVLLCTRQRGESAWVVACGNRAASAHVPQVTCLHEHREGSCVSLNPFRWLPERSNGSESGARPGVPKILVFLMQTGHSLHRRRHKKNTVHAHEQTALIHRLRPLGHQAAHSRMTLISVNAQQTGQAPAKASGPPAMGLTVIVEHNAMRTHGALIQASPSRSNIGATAAASGWGAAGRLRHNERGQSPPRHSFLPQRIPLRRARGRGRCRSSIAATTLDFTKILACRGDRV